MTNYLCAFKGDISPAGLGEIFSHSLAIQSSANPGTVGAALIATWTSAWNGSPPLKNMFPNQVVYKEVTVAPILNLHDGDLGAATHVVFPAGGLAGAITSGMAPSQIAVAVSLTAGPRPNGTPIRGRFYLPLLVRSLTNDSTGLFTAQSDLNDVIGKFLDDLCALGHYPCVWTKGGKNEYTAELSYVQQSRVGNKYDTVRRRRNKGRETYVTHNVVGPT